MSRDQVQLSVFSFIFCNLVGGDLHRDLLVPLLISGKEPERLMLFLAVVPRKLYVIGRLNRNLPAVELN